MRKINFARRTGWELSSNRITGILKDLKESGQHILDLTESNPTRCGFLYPQNALLSELSKTDSMTYSPSANGLLSARQAVAAYYQSQNIAVSLQQIFLTASTSEAYSFLFRLLADPGESILFPNPSYPLFDFLVDLNDLQSGFYPLLYRNQWDVDFDGLKNNISRQTKAVVVVNPNNPTGSYIRKEEFKNLNRICQSAGLALISDEVFFDYAFEKNVDAVSFAGNSQNLTFTLGGLSKTLGLPQMKLSWIIVNGPPAIVADAVGRLEVIADTYLSVNAPVQNALSAWFKLRLAIQQEIKARVGKNREFLSQNFTVGRLGSVLRADGGWYMILKLTDGIDEESLVEELLMRDQVYVHPGYFFNFNEGSHLILSLLPSTGTFSEGVNRLIRRLKDNC